MFTCYKECLQYELCHVQGKLAVVEAEFLRESFTFSRLLASQSLSLCMHAFLNGFWQLLR